MKISYKLILIISIVYLFISPNAWSGQISADILQIKLNRIYLNAGSEELIFPNYHFWIMKNDDTTFTGKIETAYDGISISYPLDTHLSLSDLDKYKVIVETALIDTNQHIWIYSSDLSDYELSMLLNVSDIYNIDSLGGSFGNKIRYLYTHELKPDYSSKSYDIQISYIKKSNPPLGTDKIITAPYIAVLIPNLSKKINYDGLLSTSIYYIFDLNPLLHSSMIKANNHDCFVDDIDCTRAYKKDSETGKNLLNNLKVNLSEVQIGYFGSSLKDAALYISDILAQERIKAHISQDNLTADLFLIYIPYDLEKPVNTLNSILDFLKKFEISNSSHKETVSILNSYIEKLKISDSSFNKEHFYNIIDYGLKYDLSIFPLYRPIIHLNYPSNIIYRPMSNDSIFNFGNFTTIKHPQGYSGEIE